ncbi:acidic amino acid decarboxylase GADL1 isoform X2 [Bombyx mandarina]|uniref:Acidic amino acid decarboxylase GADL1 isoform X1 n=1 Tax=Bombyx mandarina TaxID=7092 RepID=A0A6J2KAH9_BOMMA|nr:acidic amino acid decarboxylase GADL1 isoform X1 [Bombyx mandarina]XP_028038925.1 acidic amino acid decarboxylase GADL1 isoform X2 [Bombyx mandarina]
MDLSFLDRVLQIVKDERKKDVPLVRFKHPEELEAILDLDIGQEVNDDDLERCVRQVLQYSVKTDKATFKNQLYGCTDPYGLAGAWIAEAFNTSQYTFEVAPVFTLIELKVLNHILNLFGIPNGDGIFSPGGSVSMLYALVAARFKAFPEVKRKGMRNLPEMVIFTSEDSHYSIRKAAHWLGFGTESLRPIKANEHGQMIVSELEKAIEREKEENRYPVLVNATAGTTVLGAIDDLNDIANVCKKHGVWMHVDACWGGSLMLSPKYRSKLLGVKRADSISWNPHKMAGAPLQCSVFLIKERGLLHEANSAAAQYLFQQDKFYDVSYDTGDKSVQCGRKIDAFKLWMMWKSRGDIGLSVLTDKVMSIAQFCLSATSKMEGFRLVSEKLQCPNVCFWYIPKFMRNKDENEEWWDLMHKITPKIKEQLTLTSKLMVAYSPLRQHKNFFRLAFTFHPELNENQVIEMLNAVKESGEAITKEMFP